MKCTALTKLRLLQTCCDAVDSISWQPPRLQKRSQRLVVRLLIGDMNNERRCSAKCGNEEAKVPSSHLWARILCIGSTVNG